LGFIFVRLWLFPFTRFIFSRCRLRILLLWKLFQVIEPWLSPPEFSTACVRVFLTGRRNKLCFTNSFQGNHLIRLSAVKGNICPIVIGVITMYVELKRNGILLMLSKRLNKK